jgi:hypothetical protein
MICNPSPSLALLANWHESGRNFSARNIKRGEKEKNVSDFLNPQSFAIFAPLRG